MKTFHKYVSITALLTAGCSASTPQAKVEPAKVQHPEPVEPDCSSLDLTKKVDFSTSFTFGEDRFCYRISSRGQHYFDAIGNCDEQGTPLPKSATVIREFAGPKAGYMESKVILDVSGDSMNYLLFNRELSGKINLLDSHNTPVTSVPASIEQLLQDGSMEQIFQNGAELLDQIRYHPAVCTELMKYRPRQY